MLATQTHIICSASCRLQRNTEEFELSHMVLVFLPTLSLSLSPLFSSWYPVVVHYTTGSVDVGYRWAADGPRWFFWRGEEVGLCVAAADGRSLGWICISERDCPLRPPQSLPAGQSDWFYNLRSFVGAVTKINTHSFGVSLPYFVLFAEQQQKHKLNSY